MKKLKLGIDWHVQAEDDGQSNRHLHYSQEQEQEGRPPIYHVSDAVKSPHTKKGYSSAFNDFLRTIGWKQDPEALRALIDLPYPSTIESKIIKFIKKLKERNLSTSTIKTKCSAVFHFFEINDITLKTRKIKRFVPEDESDNYSMDRPYSINEISQILSKCDIPSRVPILVMTSTGMRIGCARAAFRRPQKD